MKPTRKRRWWMGGTLLAMLALAGLVYLPPLPRCLRERASAARSMRFLDAHGRELRETTDPGGQYARWVGLDEVPRTLIDAVIDSEDRHFDQHPGVDPIGVIRAAWLDLRYRRIVSGGSTITMQVARMAFGVPRTVVGKVEQAVLALWLERRMSKREILEAYLNLAPFGRNIVGVEEAAQTYFGKSPAHLTLGEAAALAALPRSPDRYDPYHGRAALMRRRAHILALMARAGTIGKAAAARSAAEPLVLAHASRPFAAPQFVLAARAEAVRDGAPVATTAVHTTLEAQAQAAAETACRTVIGRLGSRHVTNCAVIVIRVSTGEVLAMVGSASFFDPLHDGQVNGALALRQPGSALKPFVYGLAFERGLTPATAIADETARFPTPKGDFIPRNYDDRLHGPVRAREALANSYNIPAARVAASVGPGAILQRLHALGFESLDRSADHYGVAIALGDGEVRLLELAGAYATIARGGEYLAPRMVTAFDRRTPGGTLVTERVPRRAPRRVMPATVAFLLTDILSDRNARLPAFGESSALELPFPAAAKTGTSKNYRDNWTAGFAGDVVVAAWVGNFDGSPMRGVSGVTGAAPVFRSVLASVLGRNAPRARVSPPAGVVTARICPLSGELAGPSCPHSIREYFVAGTAPTARCHLHGGGTAAHAAAPIAILEPHDGDRYALDPARRAASQAIPIRIRATTAQAVRLTMDGHRLRAAGRGDEVLWTPTLGTHRITASDGAASASVVIHVHGAPRSPAARRHQG